MCSLPCKSSGFLKGPDNSACPSSDACLVTSSRIDSADEWVEIEVGELQRRIARHVALEIHIAVERERCLGKLRACRQRELPPLSDRVGDQVADSVSIDHEAGDLHMPVDHRMLQGPGSLHREVHHARGLQTLQLDLRHVGEIDALRRAGRACPLRYGSCMRPTLRLCRAPPPGRCRSASLRDWQTQSSR